ncbi:hypothetical protein [Bradyrhizobium rifense]|uniref:hypothetical protein n=1 Tax=Bradyrhizobium rifense TaxID=515499 RepID=UPI001653201F|nr:hypothetical protein [Bradyrhizobium rifense]
MDRGGAARSSNIDAVTLNEIIKIVRENVNRETVVETDESRWTCSLARTSRAMAP